MQTEYLSRSLSQSSDLLLGNGSSLQGIGGSLSSASILEHLQSTLKQKEGELSNSQNMVASLERSRSAMAEELALLSANNEKLQKEVEMIPELKQQLLVSSHL